jgi:chromosome segregation ATPase
MRGRPDGTPGKTLSQTDMNTKIDELFATLRILIADQSRDLAMAMAELRSVAQQRDKALTERDAARAAHSDLNTRVYGPGGECYMLDKARDQRDKLKAERDSANWSLSRAKESLRAAEQEVAEAESANSDLRTVNARLVADLAAAMERLNHAESIIMQ